jgi:hypothetical protein
LVPLCIADRKRKRSKKEKPLPVKASNQIDSLFKKAAERKVKVEDSVKTVGVNFLMNPGWHPQSLNSFALLFLDKARRRQ